MVRIHAPEPADLSDRLDARNKVRNKSERWPEAAAGEVAVPGVEAVADAVTPAAVSASIRADMRRALAEGLTRALAAGDGKAARMDAIVALSGLMDDAPIGAGSVVDPMTDGRAPPRAVAPIGIKMSAVGLAHIEIGTRQELGMPTPREDRRSLALGLAGLDAGSLEPVFVFGAMPTKTRAIRRTPLRPL